MQKANGSGPGSAQSVVELSKGGDYSPRSASMTGTKASIHGSSTVR